MKRAAFVLAVLVFACAAYSADKPRITGKWDITSVDEDGNQQSWVLTLKEETGKLSGTLDGGSNNDHFEILDPKLEGNTFTFSIMIGSDRVDTTCKIEGNKLQGTYSSANLGSGKITGTKQA